MTINLTCPINRLSYGLVSTALAVALDREGAAVSLFPIGPFEPEGHAAALRGMTAVPHGRNAHSLRVYHPFDLFHHVGKGTQAALTFFELGVFGERERRGMEAQDVLFVPTRWAKATLEDAGVRANVVVRPIGVDSVVVPGVASRGRPGPTRFFTVGKWEVRKGHDLLIEAFNRAFSPEDLVSLEVMCDSVVHPEGPEGADRYNAEWRRYYEGSRMGLAGKVRCLSRTDDRSGVSRLIAESDWGVFLSRAEGWNMPLAETLLAGGHAIATRSTGHLEYVDDDNCLLIDPAGRSEARDGTWFHGGRGPWDEFDMDQIVAALREAHRRRQEGPFGKNQAGREAMARFSWAECARGVLEALG